MHARYRVLAVHPAQQLGHRGRVGDLADDAEQRRFLVGLLGVGGLQQLAHAEAVLLRRDHLQHGRLGDPRGGQRLEQQIRRVVAAARQRPGNAGHDPWAALDQALDKLRKGLLADEAAEHLDEGEGRVLVRVRQRREHRLDGSGPQLLQLGDGLLRGRVRRIRRGADLGDQTVCTQIREKAHSAFPLGPIPTRSRSDLKPRNFPRKSMPRPQASVRVISLSFALSHFKRFLGRKIMPQPWPRPTAGRSASGKRARRGGTLYNLRPRSSTPPRCPAAFELSTTWRTTQP